MKYHIQNKSKRSLGLPYCKICGQGTQKGRDPNSLFSMAQVLWLNYSGVRPSRLTFSYPLPALLQYKLEGIKQLKIQARGSKKKNLEGLRDQRRVKDIKTQKREERKPGGSTLQAPPRGQVPRTWDSWEWKRNIYSCSTFWHPCVCAPD